MVAPRATDGHTRILSLFRFCTPFNRRGRNLTGYCRRRLACAHNCHQTGRVSPDTFRLAGLAVLSVDRGLFAAFAGTANQYRQDPVQLCCLPFLSHAGNRYETNGSIVSDGDDTVGDRRDRL